MTRNVEDAFKHISALMDRAESDDSHELVLELDTAMIDLSDAIGQAGGPHAAEVVTVRNEIGLSMLLESEIVRRIWEKPLGYAGDWVTLGHFSRVETPSGTRRGRFIDGAIQRMPAVQSVRERPSLIAEQIRHHARTHGAPLKVLAIASGPAVEVWDVLGAEPDVMAEVHLLDIDPSAIEHARRTAAALGCDDRVQATAVNIIKLALGEQPYPLDDFDFVYSMGLTDYFPDDLVIALLNSVHGWLRPGGSVILGNFHPRNQVANAMAAFGWELLHRTEAEMASLFEASAFKAPPTDLLWDEQRIDLFALARRA